MADYTREQIEAALRKAHEQGDEAAARALTAHLTAMGPTEPAGPSYAEQVRSEFNEMPWYRQAGTAVDDMLRLGSSGLTFGLIDRLRPYVSGRSLEDERQLTEDARIRAGGAGTMAEVGGSMIPAMAMPTLMGAVPATAGAGTRAGATLGAGALEGSAFGGLDAFGHGQDVMTGQLMGALTGVGGQAAASFISRAAQRIFGKAPERLTVEQLEQAKNQAYREMEEAGVEFTPDALDSLIRRIDEIGSGATAGRHDEAIAVGRKAREMLSPEQTIPAQTPQGPLIETPLGTVPGMEGVGPTTVRGPLSLDDIDKTRQMISRDLASHPDQAQGRFGAEMIDEVDNWLRQVGPESITTRSGDARQGIDALTEARQLNSRLRKTEQIEDAATRATRRADRSITGSAGRNVRGNIDSILSNPNRSRGYTPDELAQMDRFVRGSDPENFYGQIARMRPGGGLGLSLMGMGMGAGVGSTLGPVGSAVGMAIPPLMGVAANRAFESTSRRNLEELLSTISTGKPRGPYRDIIERASQEDLARALMMMGITE